MGAKVRALEVAMRRSKARRTPGGGI